MTKNDCIRRIPNTKGETMFNVVSKNKRLLMWTIFFISMCQMPQLAQSSAIELIKTDVFPEQSLSAIQTTMSLPSLVAVIASILAALLVRNRLVKKKTVVVAGVSMIALTGLLAIVFHTQFWQLIMFSAVIGAGMGLFIPTSQSIMCDKFDDNERQFMGGLQFSFINLGGIIMSVIGGMLTTLVWYGGYLMLLITVPVAILAIFALPKEKAYNAAEQATKEPKKRTKLPSDVFYYAGIIFVFISLNLVTFSNISTHLNNAQLGNSATAGIASAVMMGGGVFAGLLFEKLSSRYHDKMIAFAFIVMFCGFTILNVFHMSLLGIFIAVFLNGMSLSMILPQCILSTSNIVDPSNSATATMFLASIAPGSGGFLSPLVFTNLTLAIGGESTTFRYQFVGGISLAVGIILYLNTVRRNKRLDMDLEQEPEPAV